MKKSSIDRRSFISRLSMSAGGLMLAPQLHLLNQQPRKLGIALVGLGTYSTNQLAPALKQTQYCKLAGVVTGSKVKGEQWAKDYGFPVKNIYGYDTMSQLADNRDIDIIYVVTPNALHAEHAIAAAKAGKHVICEKPMATSVAECDAIISACRAAKVKLSIGYRLHFDPYHKELMRLAKEKDFGVLSKINGDRGFVMASKSWRADKKLAGGGPLLDLGIYLIHGASMAANGAAPLAVTAKYHPVTKPEIFSDVEEGISWNMEFPGGVVADLQTSYQHSKDYFKATGAKGWIEFKEHAFTYKGLVVETSRGPLNYAPAYQQALQMDDFAQCVQLNKQTRVPGELGKRDIAIIKSIYKAAETGDKVLVKV